jgi:peptidoglycan/xylan/chitin deacetylase (PgdA/CDA1 family)
MGANHNKCNKLKCQPNLIMGETNKFVDTYGEIKAFDRSGIRDFFRNVMLDGFSLRNKIIGIEKYLKKPRVQFLYIHHIFKDELENFDKLLLRLSKEHTFISYSDAVNRVLQNDIDKPYITISSDDGFKNNILALDVLKKYEARACFFINTDLIGETDFNKIKKHCREKLNFPPVEFLSWDDIEDLQEGAHEIGSHTRSHIDIGKATNVEIVNEIVESKNIIASKCGRVLHFAFPYGRFNNFNETGRQAVFDAGYISCATAERGCHVSAGQLWKSEKLCIHRDHIVLDWEIDHVLYFLANNSKNAKPENNLFPY